jgi:hypothetical protein
MSIDLTSGLKVLRVISRHNSANPVTGETVEQATGVNSRNVAVIVGIAAANGVRVASCSRGYYRPTDGEAMLYLDREKRRLISIAQKVSLAKKNQHNELSLFEQAQ